MRIVFLPGLHGTGELFNPLLKALPDTVDPLVVAYPNNRRLSYIELADYVAEHLPKDEFLIVAESFSGPVAHLVANKSPKGLKRVLFFASFLRNPNPMLLNWLTLPFAGLAMSLATDGMMRRRMIGKYDDDELWELIKATINSVPKSIIKYRLRLMAGFKAPEKTSSIPYSSYAAESDTLVRPSNSVCSTWTDDLPDLIPGPHLLLQTVPKVIANRIKSHCNS
ncbi:alpha/beta hydrolase [Planctomycetota bacterium]|nr:alpha/beta hydrolase [Planctomycetota bacterium]